MALRIPKKDLKFNPNGGIRGGHEYRRLKKEQLEEAAKREEREAARLKNTHGKD